MLEINSYIDNDLSGLRLKLFHLVIKNEVVSFRYVGLSMNLMRSSGISFKNIKKILVFLNVHGK